MKLTEKQQQKLNTYISSVSPLYEERLKISMEIGKLNIQNLLDDNQGTKTERNKEISKLNLDREVISKKIRNLMLQNNKEEKVKDEEKV